MLLAFDMFGTLADTASVAGELEAVCGHRALDVARIWRAKQLEYMFRVTAMGQFPTFVELTRWGLTRALGDFGITISPGRLDDLADGYGRLKPFDDVEPSLAAVSCNPFDLIGAGTVGLRTAWCRRDPLAVFDPWGPRLDHTVASLTGLSEIFNADHRAERPDR